MSLTWNWIRSLDIWWVLSLPLSCLQCAISHNCCESYLKLNVLLDIWCASSVASFMIKVAADCYCYQLGTITSLLMDDLDQNPWVFQINNTLLRSGQVSATRLPIPMGHNLCHGSLMGIKSIYNFYFFMSDKYNKLILDNEKCPTILDLWNLAPNIWIISDSGMKPGIWDQEWRTVAAHVDSSERLWWSSVTTSPPLKKPHLTSVDAAEKT